MHSYNLFDVISGAKSKLQMMRMELGHYQWVHPLRLGAIQVGEVHLEGEKGEVLFISNRLVANEESVLDSNQNPSLQIVVGRSGT